MSYLLDTNICISILNDRPQGVRIRLDDLLSAGDVVAVSAVSRFELQYGSAKSNQVRRNWDRLSVFFSRLSEIPFDGEDADAAGAVRAILERSGTPVGAYDVQIAGQALRRKLTLVTANVRGFKRVKGLRVEDWLDRAKG
ncbi:MAG: type II toxin-antitoxin system VapC family toxin [Alphaproteobacteria bacterium]|nr:type II toxin-antitoxin system VapC family toxin [Alphaproteobacteria bacterium]